MKKLFLILLLSFFLSASEVAVVKANIIIDIVHLIKDLKVIKIYNEDAYFNDIFKANSQLVKVNSCEDADFILTKNSSDIKNCGTDKILNIISTGYRDYSKHREIDIAAFFWQKGRPNILLNSKLMTKRKITISPEYSKFLD